MGFQAYLAKLVSTILFPILWVQSLRLAKSQQEHDPRAVPKVAAAIVVSVLLGAGGAMVLMDFQETSTDGFYSQLESRMAGATGEADYQAAADAEATALGVIALAERKLAESQAAGDENATASWQGNLESAQADLIDARAQKAELAPNHALFNQVAAAIDRRDDAAVKSLIANTNVEYERMQERTDYAFFQKDDMASDLWQVQVFMLIPSVIGMFYAPLAFAMGNILRKGWEPSESVGFKPYPGGAAGWFLLLGAFGLPSVPFAAWTFFDMDQRVAEGQIAL
ncbi:MAG: hypothetical protein ACPGQL_07730 [Thermoplasmatota archaeon]